LCETQSSPSAQQDIRLDAPIAERQRVQERPPLLIVVMRVRHGHRLTGGGALESGTESAISAVRHGLGAMRFASEPQAARAIDAERRRRTSPRRIGAC